MKHVVLLDSVPVADRAACAAAGSALEDLTKVVRVRSFLYATPSARTACRRDGGIRAQLLRPYDGAGQAGEAAAEEEAPGPTS